jgi:hypothetical protein
MMEATFPLTSALLASIATTLSAIIEAYESIQQATNFPRFFFLSLSLFCVSGEEKTERRIQRSASQTRVTLAAT